MKCPFLKDANVKYCEASAWRKMLRTESTSSGSERCSTAAWRECLAAARQPIEPEDASRCPFLHESQVEYCAAAPVTKFIPATTDLLSRCNSDGHLYCELFLGLADPRHELHPRLTCELPEGMPSIDGVPVPPHLLYAPNHMWLDLAPDGSCHIGIDAFAARLLGPVEHVSFLPRGSSRPTAVVHLRGGDVPFSFPHPLHVIATNVYLRTAPERLVEDPYGAGWLFACDDLEHAEGAKLEGLIAGDDALRWMHAELDELDRFAHRCSTRRDAGGFRTENDGGRAAPHLASSLDREELMELVADFFSPHTPLRRTS